MKNINWYKVIKIMFIAFGVVFLLVACSDDSKDAEHATPFSASASGGNNGTMADAQRGGFSGEAQDGSFMTPLKVDEPTCWQGELLEIFYKPLGAMALQVYDVLATEEVISLMMLAFSLWMAFQILRHVSSPTPESMGEFWTKVLRKGTLCFACGYLASSPDNVLYVLNSFVFPIYITLLELCGNVIDIVNTSPEASAKAILFGNSDKAICEVYNYSMTGSGSCVLSDTAKIAISKNSFPTEPLKMMSCMACAVGARLDVGYTVALYAMSGGMFGFIVGIFLLAAFTITKLGFAMYLVDSIFRLDMMVIVAPFLIMFYPFEQTRKWTVVGFKIILNSSAIMLCLGVLISMTILAMQKVLVNDQIADFGNIDVYKTFGTVPISLIFLGFVVIKASGIAVSLSESVTGGSGDTKFQKKMAALVGTVAKGIFAAVSFGAGKIVTFAVEHSQRLKAAAEKIQKTREKINKVHQKMQHLAGRDREGN